MPDQDCLSEIPEALELDDKHEIKSGFESIIARYHADVIAGCLEETGFGSIYAPVEKATAFWFIKKANKLLVPEQRKK